MISQRKKKSTQMINFDCRIVTISVNSDINVRIVTNFFEIAPSFITNYSLLSLNQI